MAKYSQAGREIQLTTPLETDALLLERVEGHEAVSELFELQLEALAEQGKEVPFAELLGRPASVAIQQSGAPPRQIHGIVRSVEEGEADEHFIPYRLELVPRLWLLTRNVQSRIFQQKTVPQILAEVFQGLDVTFKLHGAYPPHNYCVQYRESDFAFASRLMEEEGIYYFFSHGEKSEQLIVSDHSPGAEEVANQNHATFQRGQGRALISGWKKRQEVRSTKCTLEDYSFELAGKRIRASHSATATVKAGTVTHTLTTGIDRPLELYDYPGGFAHRFDGINPDGAEQAPEISKTFPDNERTARLRMDEESSQALRVQGTGRAAHFTPGSRFALQGHGNADGAYFLTRVEHRARVNFYRSGQEDAQSYANTFTCVPLELPWRPARRTPLPNIGPQTATVVGVPGEEITTDKHGRVKLQFHWDRQGKSDAHSSCWVRVAQGWAGKGYGMIHLPRIGQEVVVEFLEDDPDRPLVVGTVFNSEMTPPFPLPLAKTYQGFKAQSQGVGGDPTQFSGLAFETQGGRESVVLKSQGSRYDTVPRQHHVRVGQASNRVTGSILGVLGRGRSSKGGGSGTGGGADSWFGLGVTSAMGYSEESVATATGMMVGQERVGTLGAENDSYFGTYLFNVINPLALAQFLPSLTGYLTAEVVGAGIGVGLFNAFGVPITPSLAAYGQAILGGAADITYGSSFAIHRGTAWSIHGGTGGFKEGQRFVGIMSALYTLMDFSLYVMQEAFTPGAWPSDLGTSGDEVNRVLDLLGTLPHSMYEIWLALEISTKASGIDDTSNLDFCTLMPSVSDEADVQLAEVKLKYTEIKVMAIADAVMSLAAALMTTAAHPGAATPSSGSGSGSGLPQLTPQIAVQDNDIDQVILAPTITIAGLGAELELPTVVVQAVNAEGSASLALQMEEAIPSVTLDCGPDGILTLQSGQEQEPNFLMMDPAGIVVSSLEMITVSSAENNVVVDAEEGITLQALENLLTVSDEGILLSVGASSILISDDSITLEAGGATVELSSAGVVINGVSLALSGDSEISLDAPLMTVG